MAFGGCASMETRAAVRLLNHARLLHPLRGTAKRIHLRGFELWHFGPDGLIVESRDHYDSAVHEHRVRNGVEDQ
jgi:hypothetical protein